MNQNIFDQIIHNFENQLDKNNQQLKMDGIIISDNKNTYTTLFNNCIPKNNIRSIGKAVLGLCIGIAIDNNVILGNELLSLDTLIWPFFEKKIKINNTRNIDKLKKVTIRHLMTHTMGFNTGLLFSKDIDNIGEYNLLDYVFNYDIVYEPGTHFEYSNVGPYIISALIQDELGVSLSQWVNELLFSKICINDYSWKTYGNYCAGCTGLKLSLEDLHKITNLFLNRGKYNGVQIVSTKWIDLMHTPQILTPEKYDEKRALPKYAYGLFMWICKNGIFYCDGTDGQYSIIIPHKETAITIMGHQNDMKPICECLRPLLY